MLVSVIIPTYNRVRQLENAIASVLAQLGPGDELIVVDDGSTDATSELLRAYENRIVVVQGEHRGAGRARNLGVRMARNELVAFLDSDDSWLPGKLELQRAFMVSRPDMLFSFTNFEVQFRDGLVQPNYLELWRRDFRTWENELGLGTRFGDVAELPEGVREIVIYEADFYALQLDRFYILTDTLVVRRLDAGDALHFAEDLSTYEDLECFYRIARRGRGAFLDVDTARQTDHEHDRLSQRPSVEKLEARVKLLRRFWGADDDFLRLHAESYQRVLDGLLLELAGHHLTRGDGQSARVALAAMSSPPRQLSVLTSLPNWMIASGLALRKYLGAFR